MDIKNLKTSEIIKLLKNDLYLDENIVMELMLADNIKLAEAANNWLIRKNAAVLSMEEKMLYERKLHNQGFNYICGVDEVGRGPLAGPVVAAAVIFPKDIEIYGVDDSKRLTEKKRLALEPIIKEKALAWGIGVVSPEDIDKLNILQATLYAMKNAVNAMPIAPDYILGDAVTVPDIYVPQDPIIGGDGVSLSIGAASIIAKCYRDRLMEEYDDIYPQYGFGQHKGYGTKAHVVAITEFGYTDIHRKSFVVKNMPLKQEKLEENFDIDMETGEILPW